MILPPFHLRILPEATEQIEEATDWLGSFSPEVADRFVLVLQSELNALCQRWAGGFHPLPDEPATLYFARPVFQHLVSTGVRRRRGNTGVWRVFYDVADDDNDGQPDTIRIVAVRHSAASPLSVEYS